MCWKLHGTPTWGKVISKQLHGKLDRLLYLAIVTAGRIHQRAGPERTELSNQKAKKLPEDKYLKLDYCVFIYTQVPCCNGVFSNFIWNKYHSRIFFPVKKKKRRYFRLSLFHSHFFPNLLLICLRSSFRWIWAIKPNVSTRIEKPVVLFGTKVKCIQKDHGIL